jgi:hypothetical protein
MPKRKLGIRNVPAVELTPADLDEIGTALSAIAVQGDRYPAHLQQRVDR